MVSFLKNTSLRSNLSPRNVYHIPLKNVMWWFVVCIVLPILIFEFIKAWRWCSSPQCVSGSIKLTKDMEKTKMRLIWKLKPILKRLNIESLIIIPLPLERSNEIAFTRNKKEIHISFYTHVSWKNESKEESKKENKYVPRSDDDIIEIFLHELAHFLSKEYDPNHGKEFQEKFKKIVMISIEEGILTKKNCMFQKNCKIR